MCNPKHCQDLHAVKTLSNDYATEPEAQISNTYDWEKHKTCPFFIPSNYSSNYFNDRWFWKPTDSHDYSNPTLIKGLVLTFGQLAASGQDRSGYIERK